MTGWENHAVNRRKFLRRTSAGFIVATAGCSGDQDSDGTRSDTDEDSNGPKSDTEQDGDGPRNDTDQDSDVPTSDTETEVNTPTETDTARPTTSSGGDETIRIGVLAPKPGESPVGTAIENAVRLTAQQINDNGGLLDADLEVVVKDTSGREARLNYQRIKQWGKAEFVVGLGGNEAALGAIGEMQDNPGPVICTGAPSMRINELVNEDFEDLRYWFRLHPNAEQIGRSLADFAAATFEPMGWRNIGVVTEDTQAFGAIERTFLEERPESVNLSFTTKFSSPGVDFAEILDEGSAHDVDGIVALVSRGGTSLATEWADLKPDFGLGGWDGSTGASTYYADTKGAVRYLWSGMPGPTPHATPTERTTDFVDSYRSMYDADPPHTQAYLAHDAVVAWRLAVEAAGDTKAHTVATELANLSFDGLLGRIQFYPEGHKWVHDVKYGKDGVIPPIVQWQDTDGTGRRVGLWPENVASGDYQKPPWVES